MSDVSGLYRADDPRLADFTPEEIARGLPQQIAEEERAGTVVPPSGSGANGETEAERIARLDREQRDREFAAMQAAEAAVTQQRRTDAFSQLQTLLNRYGLGGLEGNVRDLIARGITDGQAILFQLRDTEQFRTRFKANAARAKNGLPELDPATYIGLEEQYRETLRRNLGPEMFSVYDEPDDFRKLIEGDVSAAELQQRIDKGYRLVADADPEVKRQMQTLYNVSEQELVGYFLDPSKGAPILTRQAQAAQVAARAREQAGFQLGSTTAEDLIARGYSPDQALQVFQKVGQLAGLYQEMGEEEMLTEQQKIGAAFGFDVQAEQELERRRAQRVGEFQAGGQFARTTGATSGTVETGVGTAQ